MYFCKNCGEAYSTDEAVLCVKCGVKKGFGSYYCSHCGEPVTPGADVCLSCGVATNNGISLTGKSKVAAGILGIFLGCFGVHNFYLGYTSKAVVQLVLTIVGILFTCIGIGVLLVFAVEIWGLVEGIMILAGKIDRDAAGNALTN